MKFCNVDSLEIGTKVHLKKDDKIGYISDVGILGSKLGKWMFLYHISDDNGKELFCCTEENIEVIE